MMNNFHAYTEVYNDVLLYTENCIKYTILIDTVLVNMCQGFLHFETLYNPYQ